MSARIFVGNLPMDIREREIEDIFYDFGKISDIDIKTQSRPPAFCFVSFEDHRDAMDAIRKRDGYSFDGQRLRVEMSKSRGARDDYRDDRGRGGSGGSRPAGRRTEFRVNISNLPKSASWQDLKDYMRKGGDVIYADVDRSGNGVVEFSNRDDMEYAIRKLDDTEFKNPYDSSYIRVRAMNSGRGRSRSRSYDRRSDSRSRSRSRDRSRDRGSKKSSRGRSRSPSYSRSRSRSRSRSADKVESRGRKYSDASDRSRSRSRSDSRGRSRSRSRSRSHSGGRRRSRSDSRSRSRSRSNSRSPPPSPKMAEPQVEGNANGTEA